MAWQFLQPDLDRDAGSGDVVWIDGAEAHHAAVVSRLRVGEQIRIADGRGHAVEGPIVSVSRDRVAIEVARAWTEATPTPELWLAQALAKGDRAELAIQAATELGVTGIVPWQASRSVSRWSGEKASKGAARWESIVREAAKQSLRARVPVVAPLSDARQLGELHGDGTVVVVLDPFATLRLTDACFSASACDASGPLPLATAERIVLVVGPEGGIDDRELERMGEAGAVRVRLGSPVLRTSTAGPAAIAAQQALVGEWRGPESLERGP